MKIINIFNDDRTIYLFGRKEVGELIIKKVDSFFPYYYESDPNGTSKGFDGVSLRKMIMSNPRHIRKQRSDRAYEGDILFTKRYLIDKIDTLDKAPIKYAFIDIEILSDELPNVEVADKPISCISIYNSLYKTIQQYYLGDYETEYKMIEAFTSYLRKEQFDLLLGWNFVRFDYPYLFNRIPDFAEKISPIGKSRYGDGQVFYPAGTSIIDYLTWFKKVTLNKEQAYSLDYIAQKHLGAGKKNKPDFSKLSQELKDRNKEDVELLEKLEEKFKLIPYYDEVRRLSKVEWEDMAWNTRIIDMLLLQEAKKQNVVLPMKPTDNEKEDYEGAFREAFETGMFEDIGEYDLSSAYPNVIIDFCLDPANIIIPKDPSVCNTMEGEERVTIEGTKFRQNGKALLPTITKKLIILKNDIKKKLKILQINTPEYKDTQTKYNAIKSIVNSAYGAMGNRFFRLYDKRVASATTFIVRSVLHYVKDKLEKKGHSVIYIDTDAVFIKSKKNLTELCNQLVKEWAKEKFSKDEVNIEFEYEGLYNQLFILAKCRYVGRMSKKNKIELKMKGVEAKRKDSTTFMKAFQKTLLNKILDKESKENIVLWIKEQIELVSKQSLQDIAFPCKLARSPEEYKNVPIFLRAMRNTENFKKRIGESFYYIYVNPEENLIKNTVIKLKNNPTNPSITVEKNLSRLEAIDYIKTQLNMPNLSSKEISVTHPKEKAKNVLAFDEDNQSHIDKTKIDWKTMIKRNIIMKLDTIFTAMKWDLTEIYIDLKKTRTKRIKKEDK